MKETDEYVGRLVRAVDGGAVGRIIAVDRHRSGRVIGARVSWLKPIETPDGLIPETNVFWSRLELLSVR